MVTDVHTIKFVGKKDPPDGAQIKVRSGGILGTMTVEVKLPEQDGWTQFRDLSIVDGVVTIPIMQVFLCHADEDKIVVRKIAHRLLSDGYMIWFDEIHLIAGANWKREIEMAIERCDYIIIFMSQNSFSKTGYVQREIRFALEQQELRPLGKRFIIPILLDNVSPPLELSNIQWLKVSQDDWYKKLCIALT